LRRFAILLDPKTTLQQQGALQPISRQVIQSSYSFKLLQLITFFISDNLGTTLDTIVKIKNASHIRAYLPVILVGTMLVYNLSLRSVTGSVSSRRFKSIAGNDRLVVRHDFHGPWLAFKRAVDVEDWPSAGATLNRIRQIIAVNLPLGLLVVGIGGSGRYWG
jgi:hypothetical protein